MPSFSLFNYWFQESRSSLQALFEISFPILQLLAAVFIKNLVVFTLKWRKSGLGSKIHFAQQGLVTRVGSSSNLNFNGVLFKN
jgi:hypothetical protein